MKAAMKGKGSSNSDKKVHFTAVENTESGAKGFVFMGDFAFSSLTKKVLILSVKVHCRVHSALYTGS
ncbi:MAG TPA: hypothetical protein VH280_17680 [Verrucomicrobiae bacterium]|jgi:hypothetical protein|nr:hypothetical protein [Verrucomicrobiae bacterium]